MEKVKRRATKMIKGIKAPIIADQASEMSGCTRAQYVYLVPWPGNNYEIISCSIWQNFWIIKRKNMRDISILKEKKNAQYVSWKSL